MAHLLDLRIMFFNCREVFNFTHLNELLMERSRKFIEKHLENRGNRPKNIEEVRSRLDELLRTAILVQSAVPLEEMRQLLLEILDLPNKKDSILIFGVIFDDLSFVFNKIEQLTAKSDVRNFAKACNQIVIHNNIPVVIVDSTKSFYEEDSFDNVRLFLPSIIFSSVSDIMYMSRNEHNMWKVSTIKYSRDLIPMETKP